MKLGIAGRPDHAPSSTSPLTPLFLLAALAVGLVALVTLPREEEPQISVPMVDIHVRADGLKAEDAVKLVTEPLETIVKSIDGVEHVYSQTRDDGAMVTARFLVGTSSDAAILRVHEKVRANMDRIPVGIPEPLIVGRGIDDVAIVVLTLSPKPEAAARWTANDLTPRRARAAGRARQARRCRPDLYRRRAARGDPHRARPRAAGALRRHAAAACRQGRGRQPLLPGGPGARRRRADRRSWRARRCSRPPRSATSCSPRATAARSMSATWPTSLLATDTAERRVVQLSRKATTASSRVPAVSLAIAKRRRHQCRGHRRAHHASGSSSSKGTLIPEDVDRRQSPATMARRPTRRPTSCCSTSALPPSRSSSWSRSPSAGARRWWWPSSFPTTILLTLFAARVMGYTLNRVSLFALIFSIGILVDDAIVVIENIARHWAMKDGRSRVAGRHRCGGRSRQPDHRRHADRGGGAAADAVRVGLMGPYMSPIPANASAAMIFSFFVAVIVTPWLMLKFGSGHGGMTRPWRCRTAACSAASISPSPGRSSRRKARAWIFLLARRRR